MQQEHDGDVVADEVARLVGLLAPRLRELAVLGRTEHVTRAAAELGVPQPTLSRSLARTEADLGAALLVRTGRRVRLSRAGALLLPAVDAALERLAEGVREVVTEVGGGAGGGDGGRVALGFLHTLGGSAVPQLLRAATDERPQVRFDLVQRSHGELLALLRAGDLDLCLTSPLPQEPGLRTAALAQQPLVLVAPADSRWSGRRRVRLPELAGERFVGLEHGYGLRTTTDDWCRRAGFAPQLVLTGQEIDTVRGLVAAGLGVALLPPAAGGAVPGVVEREVVSPRPSRTLGLVWRRTASPAAEPAAVRAFRELVLERAGALLAVPAGPARSGRG